MMRATASISATTTFSRMTMSPVRARKPLCCRLPPSLRDLIRARLPTSWRLSARSAMQSSNFISKIMSASSNSTALRVRSIFFCYPVRRRNSRTICAKSSTPGQPGKWVVVLSKEAGAPAIGAVNRAREAAELESLKAHPAVRAVFEAFPDAKIAAVRRTAGHEIEADDSDGDNESEAG